MIYGLLEGCDRKTSLNRTRYSVPTDSRLTERHFLSQYENNGYKPHCTVLYFASEL